MLQKIATKYISTELSTVLFALAFIPVAIVLCILGQMGKIEPITWHISGKAWTIAILFGALVTQSRTGVLMLAVIVGTYLWLRPKDLKRLWPALLPLVVALHFAAPGTIGTLQESFFPKGGVAALKAQQETANGHGRIASLGPGIKEWKRRPIFGEGYATRVVSGPNPNAPILDDQWLTTLLEVNGRCGARTLRKR